MEQKSFRNIIDEELCMLELDNAMKSRIKRDSLRKNRTHRYPAAAALIIILLCGTTVFAGYYMKNKINVNEETLPELDALKTTEMNRLDGSPNQYGMFEIDFTDYKAFSRQTGVTLLDSVLSQNNPYMLGHIFSDNKDFCIVTVENYILGDTDNYQYVNEEHHYTYDSGSQYRTPVSLTADIVLSEEQLENGWDTDYLGMYEFVETYTSAQGFRVNLIQSNNGNDGTPADAVSEKCAIFVSDGIRYTLKCRTNFDTMKEIVDSMN